MRFFSLLILASLAFADTRPRLVVLTDFYKDPDDKQSMIRLLSYANEFEIEGLIATSLAFGDGSVRPDLIHELLHSYSKVLPNLRLHERKGFEYPAADALRRVVKAGAPVIRNLVGSNKGFPVPYPPNARDSRSCDPPEKWIGPGKDNPASRHIIEVVDRDDPRPVWVTVWGGAMDLAQALWSIRSERSPAEARRLIEKLRVYQISWQDTGMLWIWNEFPELFLILNVEAMRGIYAEGPGAMRDEAWVDENIRRRGGLLGAAYPKANVAGIKEGDTPSFLYLLARGLSDPEHPEYGGWGGRFRLLDPNRRTWVSAEDNHPEWSDEERRMRWTIGRWNETTSRDFAARMTWCAQPLKDANHAPVAVIDAHPGAGVVLRNAVAGSRVSLTAGKSHDPDGDALQYRWWQYVEAGSLPQMVSLEGADAASAQFIAPDVRRPETIHIILEVTDRGAPALTSYRRIVFTVEPR
jgi:hypothetical protein